MGATGRRRSKGTTKGAPCWRTTLRRQAALRAGRWPSTSTRSKLDRCSRSCGPACCTCSRIHRLQPRAVPGCSAVQYLDTGEDRAELARSLRLRLRLRLGRQAQAHVCVLSHQAASTRPRPSSSCGARTGRSCTTTAPCPLTTPRHRAEGCASGYPSGRSRLGRGHFDETSRSRSQSATC